MVRLVLSILGAFAIIVGIFILSFTALDTKERSNGNLIYQGSEGWYGLSFKEVLGKKPEQDEWTLATTYGEIHIKESQESNNTNDNAWQFREAVTDAKLSQITLYSMIAIAILVLLVGYINRKFIEKKNPILLKTLLFMAPIYLLATLAGSLDDAVKAKEKAEKIFLEIEK